MARQLRVEYPGAVYQMMNRGDRREPIVRDDEDRKDILTTLGEACAKGGWQVHALCLMPNHFHLVLDDAEVDRATVAHGEREHGDPRSAAGKRLTINYRD
jgi:REP element-mobilizing transposase RayT